MPRVNRSELCAEDEVQVFHLINRCVRRTFLCGKDPNSGKDYSHRKQWIRDRLEVLAGIFGLDVMAFAVMSNHLHVVVRTRPDLVREWSDHEVAQRWWNLFPQRRTAQGQPDTPTQEELNHLMKDSAALAEKRSRLLSISWFMRCLAEPIARRGNRDDEVTGRFWEGRFKAQLLPDEAALTACMAYVDLNPVRAKVAATPEKSDFTSVQERIADRRVAEGSTSPEARDQAVEHGKRAGWLAPMALEPPRKKVRQRRTDRRVSNKGCLPMTLDAYLELIDWTGRQLRRDKPGRIPDGCAPILDRLQCSGETWIDLVKNFQKRLRRLSRPVNATATTRRSNSRASASVT